MKQHKLYLPQQDMEQAMLLCEQELRQVKTKQQMNGYALLADFLFFDLRYFLRLSLLGSVLLLLFGLLTSAKINEMIILYFIILGMFGIYEVFKDRYYQTMEISGPVYLHAGRRFLLKNAAISILQMLMLCVIALLSICIKEISMLSIILYAFVPLYLMQYIVMQALPYLRNFMMAMIMYVLFFVCYELLLIQLDIDQLSLILGIFTGVILLHTLGFIKYIQQESRKGMLLWN